MRHLDTCTRNGRLGFLSRPMDLAQWSDSRRRRLAPKMHTCLEKADLVEKALQVWKMGRAAHRVYKLTNGFQGNRWRLKNNCLCEKMLVLILTDLV